jgi:very-short-patch-repair endonuclease
MKKECIECNVLLDHAVSWYSQNHFGFPLCRLHQNHIRNSNSTVEAQWLYLCLKSIGIPAHLEKFDGFKTIDIAIPSFRLNIEVDGPHHNYNPDQALIDLQRTYYSFAKGYYTLRIPNSLIKSRKLSETIDFIQRFLDVSNQNGLGKF